MRLADAAAFLLLLPAAALAGCADDAGADADRDGLTDAEELAGWDVVADRFDGNVLERSLAHVSSDPGDRDSDDDGLLDVYERALGRDPRSADTDGDGLTDCQEDADSSLAHCQDPSYDGPSDGGLPTDGGRADSDATGGAGSRYLNQHLTIRDASGTMERPTPWGDGIPDATELRGFQVTVGGLTRLVRTDPLVADTDRDFLEDGEEAHLYGSDPTNPDSDGDGCGDGADARPGGGGTVAPGPQWLVWKGGEAARLRLLVAIGGVQWTIPAEGELAVGPGQNVSLAGQAAPPRPLPCGFPAYRPWAAVELYAYRTDRSPTTSLGVPQRPAFLDLRTGRLAAAADGSGTAPAAFAGAELDVGLRPIVSE